MSTPDVEPLAPLLLARLNAHLDGSQERHRLTLRNFLTGSRKWLNRSNIAREVNDWMLDVNSAESLPLRERVVNTLGNLQTTLDSLYTPVVLAWGFSQEWACDIDVEGVVERWATANARVPRNTTAQASFSAASFLEQLRALDSFFPEHLRAKAFADVAYAMLACAQHWEPRRLPTSRVGRFFVELGHVVHTGESVHRNNTVPLAQQWASLCVHSMAALDFQTLLDVSDAIAKSDLPGQYKLDAHKNAPPTLWLRSHAVFHPLLPSDEAERFEWLSFEKLYTPAEELPDHVVSMYSEKNSTVVKCYCPQLHPFLALVATPLDWCVRERMKAWVDRFASEHTAALPSLPLPAGLDDGDALAH